MEPDMQELTLETAQTIMAAALKAARDKKLKPISVVAYDNKGEPIPGAAEKWEVSDDGKLYRFTLRANGKWSNGDPVKASDFVYSYRRIMNPETGAKYATILYPILNAEKVNKGQAKLEELGARAVDDRTL